MAKVKNKKGISADKIHANKKKKLNTKKNLNPFEIHVNKEKLKVLGRKQKNDRGLPGISRAKAIEKRKRTLLQEYKIQNKSNQFLDKRIGEKNYNMTPEEKAMARFAAVRSKAHKRKSIFNLADDEILTHKGQTISEIDNFDDPRSEDEDSEEGKLNKDFVEEAHFGGGMLKKTNKEGAKSHKDLIDQLIAESKKRKMEKQKLKEATLELTEKLDTEWKDLIPLINPNKKSEELSKRQVDDYDKLMRELKFEARGTVSDRLKTEEEIAKEEKEKLEKLEMERLNRMRNSTKDKDKPNHRSADDLDDNIVYEDDTDYMLSYNVEGEPNLEIRAEINGQEIGESRREESVSEDDQLESEAEDNLSDLKEDISDSEDEAENGGKLQDEGKLQEEGKVEDESQSANQQKTEFINNVEVHIDSDLNEKLKNEGADSGRNKDLLENDKIIGVVSKELPFTFTLPDSYESLLEILENQSSKQQSTIIERMTKCNHPSLAEQNKEGLCVLFAFLLQYINDLFSQSTLDSIEKNFEIFKMLLPQIYNLAQLNPENTHNSILEVIKEKHEEYRRKPRVYPGLEVLFFFKLVNVLFSTSDFRHQIVTPCFMFFEQMLNKCRLKTKQDISYGVFICTLTLEYTTVSKRFLPAAINYLEGILHMAIPKKGVKLIKVLPPFKAISSELALWEDHSLESIEFIRMKITDLIDAVIDENYKIRVLYNTIDLLQEFFNNYKELPSCIEIFGPVLKYLELIEVNKYPTIVQDIVKSFLAALLTTKEERRLQHIVIEAKKPKALRLYEPKIETVYDRKQHKMQSKEKAERSKLLHKLKRETKGALREIRRDKAFLGRVKINQKIEKDKERREKVKRIYAEAASQQSELNELDRKKKRKK